MRPKGGETNPNDKKQIGVTLDAYHKFAVRRLADAYGKSHSNMVASMVEQWMIEHQDVVREAEAALGDFRKSGDDR